MKRDHSGMITALVSMLNTLVCLHLVWCSGKNAKFSAPGGKKDESFRNRLFDLMAQK